MYLIFIDSFRILNEIIFKMPKEKSTKSQEDQIDIYLHPVQGPEVQTTLPLRDNDMKFVELGDWHRFVGRGRSFQQIKLQESCIYLPMNTTLIKDCKV